MSQQRKIRYHLRQLHEIRDIMNTMKNLAFFETRKLTGQLQNQQQMVAELEQMAAVFLAHYPYPASLPAGDCQIWLLFGSERGFCGEFNQALLHELDKQRTPDRQWLLPIGRKLCSRLEQDQRVAHRLSGAEVVESVTPVLTALVSQLIPMLDKPPCQLFALFHHSDEGKLIRRQLMPPFRHLTPPAEATAYPPDLTLPPATFFRQLVDHYLYVVLHEIAYQSLMAENTRRIEHMTGAISRLEEREAELIRQYHRYRQEAITEELEVILLNSGTGSPGAGQIG